MNIYLKSCLKHQGDDGYYCFRSSSFHSVLKALRHVILCNFRSLFYFIYVSLNSWYLNKPDEDWYWPVEISQLYSISRCLISPCKSLLDCNVFNFIYFDWSRSFWIQRWARLFVHGFCSGFFTLTKLNTKELHVWGGYQTNFIREHLPKIVSGDFCMAPLFQVSIHVHPCHPLPPTTGNT